MSDLRDELTKVYRQHGQLTPGVVLEEARSPEHPLHGRFEWDDSAAAEKYRRSQAHELITSVRITYKDAGGKPRDVRQFHAVRREDQFVYEPLEQVANDDVTQQIVLRDMERDWKTLKRRYEHLREFIDLVKSDVDAA